MNLLDYNSRDKSALYFTKAVTRERRLVSNMSKAIESGEESAKSLRSVWSARRQTPAKTGNDCSKRGTVRAKSEKFLAVMMITLGFCETRGQDRAFRFSNETVLWIETWEETRSARRT